LFKAKEEDIIDEVGILAAIQNIIDALKHLFKK
jgi:hypothetical protein